jgi:hypothetical protein
MRQALGAVAKHVVNEIIHWLLEVFANSWA